MFLQDKLIYQVETKIGSKIIIMNYKIVKILL